MKFCSSCSTNKDASEFSKRKASKDGLAAKCKVCAKVYLAEYYVKNKAEISVQHAEYYQANKETIVSHVKQYYEDNKEACAVRVKSWQEANPEKVVAAKKKHHENNREAHQARVAQRRLRMSEKMTALDTRKSVMHRKRIADDPCYYCGLYAETMHNDHYYPIARGGTDHWWNIVRACHDCNLSKGPKLASEWVR